MKDHIPPKSPEHHVPCPHCGAYLQTDAARCWLCNAAASTQTAGHKRAPLSGLRPWQYSLESLLLAITLVAVCLGMIMALPGLFIIVAILAAPLLLYTHVAGYRERIPATPKTLSEWLLTFVYSTAVALVVLVAIGAAFVAALLALCALSPSIH